MMCSRREVESVFLIVFLKKRNADIHICVHEKKCSYVHDKKCTYVHEEKCTYFHEKKCTIFMKKCTYVHEESGDVYKK